MFCFFFDFPNCFGSYVAVYEIEFIIFFLLILRHLAHRKMINIFNVVDSSCAVTAIVNADGGRIISRLQVVFYLQAQLVAALFKTELACSVLHIHGMRDHHAVGGVYFQIQ